MAYFRGTLQGTGKKVSRQGSKKSGLELTASTEKTICSVRLYYNPGTQATWAELEVVESTGRLVSSIYIDIE